MHTTISTDSTFTQEYSEYLMACFGDKPLKEILRTTLLGQVVAYDNKLWVAIPQQPSDMGSQVAEQLEKNGLVNNADHMIHIVSPKHGKRFISFDKAKVSNDHKDMRSVLVQHKGTEYLCTPTGKIISLVTKRYMKWALNHGDAVAIRKEADKVFTLRFECE